jgi:hypothetical protein
MGNLETWELRPDADAIRQADAEVKARLNGNSSTDNVERKLPKHLRGRVQSVNTLMIKPIPEIDWVVPYLIPEGLTILAGKGKMGKSYLILGIALDIAEGKPVLGTTEAKQGRALFITPDDRAENGLRARIRGLRNGVDTPIPVDYALDWEALDNGGIGDLRDYLDYYPDTRMIVIDVLVNVLRPLTEIKVPVIAVE